MIELVSIYHHFYPQRCFGGGLIFGRMNVNLSLHSSWSTFKARRKETTTPKCMVAIGNLAVFA